MPRIVRPSRQEDHAFLGQWRITDMELWDREYLNMEVPAFIRFGEDRQGEFQFGLVRGWMDYRILEGGDRPRVEFSWEGADELEEVSGRGWAELSDNHLEGRIYIHRGDDSSFVAERDESLA